MSEAKKVGTINQELSRIQKNLKAPKAQFNKFASFNYRSCEDILEAVKPLLNGLCLVLNDEVVVIGDRYYVKATATISNEITSISAIAFARESLIKKGMDEAQITGTASSYARKYALNGLFAIDDTKDSDTKPARKLSSKEEFDIAIKMIKASKDRKALAGWKVKINGSKKYTKEQKIEITNQIDKQVINLIDEKVVAGI